MRKKGGEDGRRGEGKEKGRCKKEEGRRRRRKREGRRKGGGGGGRERGGGREEEEEGRRRRRKREGIKKGKRLEEGNYNQTDISYKGYKQMVFQVMLIS